MWRYVTPFETTGIGGKSGDSGALLGSILENEATYQRRPCFGRPGAPVKEAAQRLPGKLRKTLR
jgi:hypothetical protein